jgi:lambda repressor-like predicted transcriptional regulator
MNDVFIVCAVEMREWQDMLAERGISLQQIAEASKLSTEQVEQVLDDAYPVTPQHMMQVHQAMDSLFS